MNAPAEKSYSSDHVLQTPIWVTVIRGFQFLLGLIIVGLAGRLMHDAYLDEFGLALAIGLITWIVVGYILITEKIPSCHSAYHILAVLILDCLMVILWLATFAAVAARRAQFVFKTSVSECIDDGSLIGSKTCFRKREILKRDVLLFKSGADMMSAIAGLGALVWILFIVTLVWTSIQFHHGRKDGRFPIGTSSNTNQPTAATVENYQMEPKPHDPNQQFQQQQQGPYPMQPQPGMMQNHPPQGQYAPPPAGSYPDGGYQQAVSPSSAQGPYPPPAQYPQDQQMYGQYPQQQQQQYYPQQQPYQPPTSPSPVTHTTESVTMPSQSPPPPQELAPQPYPQAPQEMPSSTYHAPQNQHHGQQQ